MQVTMQSIGTVHTESRDLPRHWSVSDVKGTLEIDAEYAQGLAGIQPGEEIVVIFSFHESPEFKSKSLQQRPPHMNGEKKGVFRTCSPYRPNPVGLSVVEVLAVHGNRIDVRGIDMREGTPILDIKPHVKKEEASAA